MPKTAVTQQHTHKIVTSQLVVTANAAMTLMWLTVWQHCCTRFVELRDLQVALCSLEIAQVQFANFSPNPDPDWNSSLSLILTVAKLSSAFFKSYSVTNCMQHFYKNGDTFCAVDDRMSFLPNCCRRPRQVAGSSTTTSMTHCWRTGRRRISRKTSAKQRGKSTSARNSAFTSARWFRPGISHIPSTICSRHRRRGS